MLIGVQRHRIAQQAKSGIVDQKIWQHRPVVQLGKQGFCCALRAQIQCNGAGPLSSPVLDILSDGRQIRGLISHQHELVALISQQICEGRTNPVRGARYDGNLLRHCVVSRHVFVSQAQVEIYLEPKGLAISRQHAPDPAVVKRTP